MRTDEAVLAVLGLRDAFPDDDDFESAVLELYRIAGGDPHPGEGDRKDKKAKMFIREDSLGRRNCYETGRGKIDCPDKLRSQAGKRRLRPTKQPEKPTAPDIREGAGHRAHPVVNRLRRAFGDTTAHRKLHAEARRAEDAHARLMRSRNDWHEMEVDSREWRENDRLWRVAADARKVAEASSQRQREKLLKAVGSLNATPTRIEPIWEQALLDHLPWSEFGPVNEEAKPAAEEGLSFVGALLGRGGGLAVRFVNNRSSTFSSRYYKPVIGGPSYVALGRDVRRPNSTVHELGHVIEGAYPEVFRKCVDFLRKRTQGKSFVSLETLEGGETLHGQYGCEDDFGRAFDGIDAHYCGQAYRNPLTGNIVATEILSQGIQKLYDDPSRLIEEDPEYAALVLSCLLPEVGSKSLSHGTKAAKRNVRGQPCPPGYTKKRDGCIPTGKKTQKPKGSAKQSQSQSVYSDRDKKPESEDAQMRATATPEKQTQAKLKNPNRLPRQDVLYTAAVLDPASASIVFNKLFRPLQEIMDFVPDSDIDGGWTAVDYNGNRLPHHRTLHFPGALPDDEADALVGKKRIMKVIGFGKTDKAVAALVEDDMPSPHGPRHITLAYNPREDGHPKDSNAITEWHYLEEFGLRPFTVHATIREIPKGKAGDVLPPVIPVPDHKYGDDNRDLAVAMLEGVRSDKGSVASVHALFDLFDDLGISDALKQHSHYLRVTDNYQYKASLQRTLEQAAIKAGVINLEDAPYHRAAVESHASIDKAVRGSIRKTSSDRHPTTGMVRKLLSSLGVKGVSVRQDGSYISVTVPQRYDLSYDVNNSDWMTYVDDQIKLRVTSNDPATRANNKSKKDIARILKRAFPNTNDLSDSQTDHFDFVWIIN